MSAITHRTIETNGINMYIAEAGAGPLVLLLHGFPELWYSWRHQLPALAAAGYHAVAPDVRGYGRSDAPQPIEAYSMRTLVADYVGLLDALGEQTAVIVGHDWGAPMAWVSAILHPERYRAVVGLSVPYTARPPAPPTQLMRSRFGDTFFYILYFQEPGVADAELDADAGRSLRLIIYAASGEGFQATSFAGSQPATGLLDRLPEPEQPMPWLSSADLDYFTTEFARTGFRGGLNRYRNIDRDWEELPQLAGARVTQPALFIMGDRDLTVALAPAAVDTMKTLCDDLRGAMLLPGTGHWTQQERPVEVNDALIAFLDSL